ncbi:hypothetical protein [Streptomyces sp. NPDC058527]|uniref:hypothetical protein n=1 Tax=unclassified Streptomyces TaxID=2593676 RepID=UPI0036547BF8
MIGAIAFKYRTGTPRMDLPKRFGSWKGRPQSAADVGHRRTVRGVRAHLSAPRSQSAPRQPLALVSTRPWAPHRCRPPYSSAASAVPAIGRRRPW